MGGGEAERVRMRERTRTPACVCLVLIGKLCMYVVGGGTCKHEHHVAFTC